MNIVNVGEARQACVRSWVTAGVGGVWRGQAQSEAELPEELLQK